LTDARRLTAAIQNACRRRNTGTSHSRETLCDISDQLLLLENNMSNELFQNIRIETERLILRSFKADDKNEFFEIIQDPAIYKTLPEDHMYNREEVDGIIDFFLSCYSTNKIGYIRKFPLAITLKLKGEIIGNVGIGYYSQDESKMEIFYFINSKYWNKGYTSEAVSEFLNYVKSNKLVSELIGTVVSNNTASIKILEYNGFQKFEHTYDDSRIFYRRVI
jgi:ribosomal-protein-alanine N-acetyltransferase